MDFLSDHFYLRGPSPCLPSCKSTERCSRCAGQADIFSGERPHISGGGTTHSLMSLPCQRVSARHTSNTPCDPKQRYHHVLYSPRRELMTHRDATTAWTEQKLPFSKDPCKEEPVNLYFIVVIWLFMNAHFIDNVGLF